MPYWRYTLFESETTETTSVEVPVHGFDRFLLTVDINGSGEVKIDARLEGSQWREIAVFTGNGELAVDNYGWYEVRARTENLSENTSVSVRLSGRPL